jgi:hypothetical protein
MAKLRRAGKARTRRAAKPDAREVLRKSVFNLASEMEEPLRHAAQMVHVIALVDPSHDEDKEAIGLVAQEAGERLQAVSDTVRDLFAMCRPG